MKLKEVLDKTTNFFKDKKLETPRLDAELLLAAGLGLNRIDLYVKFDQPLSENELGTCREYVRRRGQGEPVAYILGNKYFYNHRFKVNQNVLIPRPETELIVEDAIQWVRKNQKESIEILDLGTGSGCIVISLLKEFPGAHAVAVDISAEALEVAKQNAIEHQVEDRLQLIQANASDFNLVQNQFKKSELQFDLIVSNPPYIDKNTNYTEKYVIKYEPMSALFAEEEGLQLLKSWSQSYIKLLKPNALMLMEMSFDQGPRMLEHFHSLQVFSEVKIIKDLSQHDRIIRGVKNG